jgi:HK97 gp10 family phage protein
MKIIFTGDFSIFEKLKEATKKAVKDSLKKATLVAVSEAKKQCPVKTGRLRSSITFAISGEGGNTARFKGEEVTSIKEPAAKDKEIVAAVGTDVKYAPYVEYGTDRQMAQPYLSPGLKIGRKKLRDFIKKAFKAITFSKFNK